MGEINEKNLFYRRSFFWEKEITIALYNTCSQILQEDDTFDFLFHTCHKLFSQQAIRIILQLKKEYPNKHVSIVAIIDSLQLDADQKKTKNLLSINGFAENVVDQIEFAPRIIGKCENHKNQFIQHVHKINRWIYSQCDHILTYYYENLPTNIYRFLTYASSHNPSLIVHHLYLPDTKYIIDKMIELLPKNKHFSIVARHKGKTYGSNELCVSYSRAQKLTKQAVIKIYRQLKKNYRNNNTQSSGHCLYYCL